MEEVERSSYWTEDYNESLNYWFWLRQLGKLDDGELLKHARHTLGLESFDGHLEVREQAGFNEYLAVWRLWKRNQITNYRSASGMVPTKTLREHLKAVAAVGAKPFAIQWVMAPFTERWVLPPSVVLLGADGGTAEDHRKAVLEAARALVRAS